MVLQVLTRADSCNKSFQQKIPKLQVILLTEDPPNMFAALLSAFP